MAFRSILLLPMPAKLAGQVIRPHVCSRRAAFNLSLLKWQTRRGLHPSAAEDVEGLATLPEPDTARGAIALGLKLTGAGEWERAQVYFERALELPGTGIKRWRDKPAGASDGEKSAALFNIACCQSQLGNIQNGLLALAGCLEAGYDDFRQLRSDPDLANLRKNEKFEGLLKRFERRGGFGSLFNL